MDGREATELIERLKIPKAALARLADVHETTLYSYLDDKSVSTLNRHKIVVTIGEVTRWMATLSFPPSFREWRAVQSAIGEYRLARLREVGPDVMRKEYGPAVDHVQVARESGE